MTTLYLLLLMLLAGTRFKIGDDRHYTIGPLQNVTIPTFWTLLGSSIPGILAVILAYNLGHVC